MQGTPEQIVQILRNAAELLSNALVVGRAGATVASTIADLGTLADNLALDAALRARQSSAEAAPTQDTP